MLDRLEIRLFVNPEIFRDCDDDEWLENLLGVEAVKLGREAYQRGPHVRYIAGNFQAPLGDEPT